MIVIKDFFLILTFWHLSVWKKKDSYMPCVAMAINNKCDWYVMWHMRGKKKSTIILQILFWGHSQLILFWKFWEPFCQNGIFISLRNQPNFILQNSRNSGILLDSSWNQWRTIKTSCYTDNLHFQHDGSSGYYFSLMGAWTSDLRRQSLSDISQLLDHNH